MKPNHWRLLIGMAALSLTAMAPPALSASPARCAGARDLRIVNGRIHTMDARDSVISSVTIREGRFVADADTGPCTRIVDVKGRTVVPGLIDNHNHFVLLGLRPGHDTRLESAASIADVKAIIASRASTVPAGAWITSLGGWTPGQLAENRMPTLAELDAAAPRHPVLVFTSFTGPSAANSLGKAFFTDHGVAVGADGSIAAGPPSMGALNALRAIQTFEDKKQGVLDAMAYSASVGVTTNVDMGEFIEPGTAHVDDSFTFDTLASGDPFAMYEPSLALSREGRLSTRLRIFFLMMDQRPDVPMTTQRVLNAFDRFGDDMLRVSGVGEFATSWPFLFGGGCPANYEAALDIVAERGWAFQQHSLSSAEDDCILKTYEAVNAKTPISGLRWSMAHVPHITEANLETAKRLNVGMAVHPYEYLSNAATPGAGPPLRTILASGVHVGAGSDSAQISTLNPWNMIYYMVTGNNAGGHLVNDGQQISREQAIRLYTAENGWFFNEEDRLGSIEPGKLGDLVVLSDDYFDPKRVPDSELRKLHSVLTVVDGKVIYDAMH
jgi:predicted amidohydrolase YtcJ